MKDLLNRIQSEAQAGNCSTIIGLCAEGLENDTRPVVTFKEKSVYGRNLIYPACDKSNLFAGLLSTKTLTSGQLSLIESLGYTVHLIALSN